MADSEPADPIDVFMWRRINGQLTTSGQPTEEQFESIKDLGATHVVNLGLHEHEKALPNEALTVAKLGMEYIHIPVDFDNPTDEDFVRFRLVMRELGENTIHVHCIANLRVSAFLFRYRRDDLAMPDSKAREEMESIWRPGGVWASFIADEEGSRLPHRFAGRDY